jgi:glycosyltransferase involved in cell wall biosynthesis
VSVIMNVYNGEAFLAEAIDCVFAQTFTDWELILWDDCSTDDSAAVCARYDDPRVRYFRHPVRVSIGEARNHAIAEARGEWLAFLDQDDIWLPDKLARQNAVIAADCDGRLGLVYGRTLRFDPRGRRSDFDPWYGPQPLPQGDIFEDLLRRPSFIALSSVAIRATALHDIGAIPPTVVYCPDYYLCLHVAERYRALCLQDLCCLYREHGANMSKAYRRQIHEEAIHIIESAARPSQQHILRRRRIVHQTWIGVEQLRSGGEVWAGLSRILFRGSLPYLIVRPLLIFGRRVRRMAARF